MTVSPPDPARPGMQGLPNEALSQVANYFQALAEPTRLQILNLLRPRERNVSDLAQLCSCSIGNMSRHLALLTLRGFVVRESRGSSAYYRVADRSVYLLCDRVCGSIAREFERSAPSRESFGTRAGGTL